MNITQQERVAQKTKTCPRCSAEPGKPCSRPAFGNPYRLSYLARPHEARVELVVQPLAGMLRPGSAGSNTAADHVTVLDAASYQGEFVSFAGCWA